MTSIPKPSLHRTRLARRVAATLAVPFAFVTAPLRAGELPPVMFVTSTSGNGNFGNDGNWAETDGLGLSGFGAADKICQVRAEAAGLAEDGSPDFRAWVSIGSTEAYCHVLGLTGARLGNCGGFEPFPSPGPYYRTDGVPLLDSLDAVISGVLSSASRDENGSFVSSVAWTGSNYDGTATASTCSGWGSTSGFGSVGSTTSAKYWGEIELDGTLDCVNSAHLYCFAAPGIAPPRPAWPEPSALVFLRTGGGSGDLDGIGGADVTCQDQAATYGLPGADSFLAWLSDAATNAKDRFTIDGPWYRADGVRVAASLAALTDGDIDSAINRLPQGGLLSESDRVWTGTFGNGTKSTNNCVDWFTFNADQHGTFGLSDETGNSWTSAPTSPEWTDACNQAGRFYCFGDTIVVFWDRFETGNLSRWSGNVGFAP